MKVQKFNYTIEEIIPLENLHLYSEHRRLRVFFNKGCSCVNCGLKGTQLIKGKDKHGNFHIDLCDENFYPLTVDHILPVSKGGTNDLENLQPYCFDCNNKKGNGDILPSSKRKYPKYKKNKYKKIDSSVKVNTELFVRTGSRKSRIRSIGNFQEFAINPHNNEFSVKINKSFYNISAVYELTIF